MIKRLLSIILVLLGCLLCHSCIKCRTCQCWKNGIEYEEKNCAYGGFTSLRSQKVWEEYLLDENGYDYDSVKCITE